MQFLVPGYLEQAMVSFARNQDQMRDTLRATFGLFPFGQFEEMGKQNMALFEQALKMLSPYGAAPNGDKPAPGPKATPAEPTADPRLQRLEAQLDAMRKQLDALTKKG
jgi:polyhydroxyalkanoate synthesis regulator protein